MFSNPNGAGTNPELMSGDTVHGKGGGILARLGSSDPMEHRS